MKQNFLPSSLFSRLEINRPLAFLIHIAFSLFLVASAIFCFFEFYLPTTTHHGETLTVPDLRGFSLEEAHEFLSHTDLQLTVGDSDFVMGEQAGIILSQLPKPMEHVKIGRRIYLTLNQYNAPTTRLPNIYDVNLKNAIQLLESFQLEVGKTTYLPHPQSDRVLELLVNDTLISKEQLEKGFLVTQGTKIDLQVGDGMGAIDVTMPKLVGRPADEAEIYALGIGLHVSQLHWVAKTGKRSGTVVRQKPYYGTKMRKGQGIEIWVSSGY